MNNYGIADHTVEHFRTNPQSVKNMIEKLEAMKNRGSINRQDRLFLKQWRYIASRIGLTDKVKVVFS